MTITTLPTRPHAVATDTWLIPTYVPAMPGTWVGVHSLVIRGAQPIIVDTGASLVRDAWFDAAFSVVEPGDVRWVFLSHDDHDHVGNLLEVLERCPNATLIANFSITTRLSADLELPAHRMRWLDHGDRLDAGDRTFHLLRPPMFDAPSTRGLYDSRTSLLWAVDSFGALVDTDVYERSDVSADLYAESFDLLNSWNTPWMEWLDTERFHAHVATSRRLPIDVIASAHGPILRGAQIDDAFDRTMALAARPALPTPGQETLDGIIASAFAAPTVSTLT